MIELTIDPVDLSGSQQPNEIRDAAEAIAARMTPDVVVEIGAYTGASLRVWSQIASKRAILVAIDPDPDRITKFATLSQEACRIGNTSDDARGPLAAMLGSYRIDFLFIDGDHRRPQEDFDLYLPLMASPSIVGFHDIDHDGEGFVTREVWHHLRGQYERQEFIEPGSAMGIGLLYLP